MSSPDPSHPSPAGPDQSLPAAGLFAICAATLSTPSSFLRPYLARVLSNTLSLPSGAQSALIQQSLELSTSKKPFPPARHALHGYLSAAAFAPDSAVPLIASFLAADVTRSTVYDSRARETLMRLATVLRLPQRVVYEAERELANLVHSLMANAVGEDGTNVEAVAEDPAQARKRKNAKWFKIGTASVVGGLALGMTGGLIAPALLPALGTVGLASVSAPLAALGGGGAVAVGGIFGAAGAGVGAAAMSSRTGDVQEFRFEKCVKRGVDRYDDIRVASGRRDYDVNIGVGKEESEGVLGGLLVWELLISQDHAMIVPGGMAFKVLHRGHGQRETSLLPEETMDAGGLDKLGDPRKRRITGAITVHGQGEYILRFRLLPGSLPVNVSYRVALVPPGKDPPVWIMEENEYEPLELVTGDVRSLSMVILVPGLLNTDAKGAYPGMCADQFSETADSYAAYDIQAFALRWESALMIELSVALRRLLGKMALSAAAQNGAMMIAPALVGAVALPVSILGAIRTLIGNIWAKTISRASECGYMLAAELASRSFGNRPVVLVGYSAGALVIFSCLQELARRNLAGIVHDVCLMGAPCTADSKKWQEVRQVVSGRLVNVFNPKDWYLELYHRGTNLGSVAGTRPIQDVNGRMNIENVCLTPEQIGSHMDYAKRCNEILADIGFCNPDLVRPWRELENVSEGSGEDSSKVQMVHVDPPPFPDFPEDLGADEGVDLDEDVVVYSAGGHRRKKLGLERSLTQDSSVTL